MPGSPSPAATLSSQLLCYSIERWRHTGAKQPPSGGVMRWRWVPKAARVLERHAGTRLDPLSVATRPSYLPDALVPSDLFCSNRQQR